MLDFRIKKFDELQLNELYALLNLRSEIFVVEQDCVYQDIDFKDQKAWHVLGYKQDLLVAYTRIFGPNDYFELASIGRVLVRKEERHLKYGYELMKKSIAHIDDYYGAVEIKISAQTYLKRFYESFGFVQMGEGYLEDGIPHIAMVRS